ncbi:hypothetical protein TNCV_1735841 [Trichonephila clavipes]|nr:hypothetical protein TNCV_1735841 [Trichonephila clavipes]
MDQTCGYGSMAPMIARSHTIEVFSLWDHFKELARSLPVSIMWKFGEWGTNSGVIHVTMTDVVGERCPSLVT